MQVAGEIKHVKTRWKWAALTSIALVSILYMLITTAYVKTIPIP